MDEQAARFADAARYFGSVVSELRDDQWAAPTPCPDWNVRDLVNHVTVEQLWALPLLAGKSVADVGDSLDGDQLGTDPKAAWAAAVSRSTAAFSAPGALARTVHLSYGDDSARNYCDQMTLDALVHGWDLARGAGIDDTLPADLLAWAWHFCESVHEQLTGSGLFGVPAPVAAGSDEQTRLLALLGRRR